MTAPSPAGCRIGIVVENKHDFQLELRRDEFGSPVLVEFGGDPEGRHVAGGCSRGHGGSQPGASELMPEERVLRSRLPYEGLVIERNFLARTPG
jgi:hypothetical protein